MKTRNLTSGSPTIISYARFSDIKSRRFLKRISLIGHRITVKFRIELLENVWQRQEVPPRSLTADGPRRASTLEQHLQLIECERAVSSGQRISDCTDNIDVAGSQHVNCLRDRFASRTGTVDIAKKLRVVWKLSLKFVILEVQLERVVEGSRLQQ